MNVDDESPLLDEETAADFHKFVSKILFLCKLGIPDIMTAIAFFTTCVKTPTKSDDIKLARVIQYLKPSKDLKLTLKDYSTNTIIWWFNEWNQT